MAATGRNEKASLGHFAKSQAKYGTTTKSTYTNETYVKHKLEKGETLQGIALKYNVTMEQLKRANNMWTNDSLFMRTFVLIPLDKGPAGIGQPVLNGQSSNKSHSVDSPVSPDDEIITKQELQKMSRSRSVQSELKEQGADRQRQERKTQGELSATDFLSSFDSSLASIKDNIQRLEDSTEFPEDHTNPLHLLPTNRRSTSRYSSRHKSHHHNRNPQAELDPCREPQLAFKSRYGRQLEASNRASMEATQDTLYQL